MHNYLDTYQIYIDIKKKINLDILKIIVKYSNNISYSCQNCSVNIPNGVEICPKCFKFFCINCHMKFSVFNY